jgi:hypothetical protein
VAIHIDFLGRKGGRAAAGHGNEDEQRYSVVQHCRLNVCVARLIPRGKSDSSTSIDRYSNRFHSGSLCRGHSSIDKAPCHWQTNTGRGSTDHWRYSSIQWEVQDHRKSGTTPSQVAVAVVGRMVYSCRQPANQPCRPRLRQPCQTCQVQSDLTGQRLASCRPMRWPYHQRCRALIRCPHTPQSPPPKSTP